MTTKISDKTVSRGVSNADHPSTRLAGKMRLRIKPSAPRFSFLHHQLVGWSDLRHSFFSRLAREAMSGWGPTRKNSVRAYVFRNHGLSASRKHAAGYLRRPPLLQMAA